MLATVMATCALFTAAGCGAVRMELDVPQTVTPSCRVAVPADVLTVQWIRPGDEDDRTSLRAWCDPVGPVVQFVPSITLSPVAQLQRPLTIVSWNMAVGDGNLRALKATLPGPDEVGGSHIILLLQEAYRAAEVPQTCHARSGFPGRLGTQRPEQTDILKLAEDLQMYAVYVPSMRNGSDCASQPYEDRGNAILSTLPLTDIVAIELPFVQERRVAVAAAVRDGSRLLRVMSVHFDTFFPAHKRQAQGIWKAVDDILKWREPIVIAGDVNSPPLDPGVPEMRKKFAEVHCGSGPTRGMFRLDRMFTRGIAAAVACETGGQAMRYGSDHRPLIARMPDEQVPVVAITPRPLQP